MYILGICAMGILICLIPFIAIFSILCIFPIYILVYIATIIYDSYTYTKYHFIDFYNNGIVITES
jgi:hypothetical protein